jgi:hypothetical protein
MGMKHAFAFLAAVMSLVSGAPAQTVERPDPAVENVILGESMNGLVLVDDVSRACPHVAESLGRWPRDKRIMLLADRAMSRFYAEACLDACVLSDFNNAVARCRIEQGINGCVIYGAIYSAQIYSLSLDGHGGDVRYSCPIDTSEPGS